MNKAIQIATEKINALKTKNKYELKAKLQMIDYYLMDNVEALGKTDVEKVKAHKWRSEMLTKASRLKKFDLLKAQVVKLERHAYAPEMNCIHFKSGRTFSTPQKTEFDEALLYASYHLSEADISHYSSPNYMKHFQN
jgi:hypothetical protein